MEIYTGLDLSRKRLDWHALRADGTLVGAGAVPPDPDGLARHLLYSEGPEAEPMARAIREGRHVEVPDDPLRLRFPLFKSALQGILPDTILDRPKMGFGVPLELWFRTGERVAGLRG